MSLLIDTLKSVDAIHLESILPLLESRDFSIDYQEPETGCTALMYALETGNEEVALELIRRGANVDLAAFERGHALDDGLCDELLLRHGRNYRSRARPGGDGD
jgi:ankyrin repeat protein